jgi:hypothetical protein
VLLRASACLAALALVGCFDFGALKPKPGDGGREDAGDAAHEGGACVPGCTDDTWTICDGEDVRMYKCELGCDSMNQCATFTPKWWTLEQARTIPLGTQDLIIEDGEHWVVWTNDEGPPEIRVRTTMPNTASTGLNYNTERAAGDLRDFPASELTLGPNEDRAPVVVLNARNVSIAAGGSLHAVGGDLDSAGGRALAIVASGSIKIRGLVDAGSWGRSIVVGAGASSDTDGRGANGGELDGNYGFGGGGGGYASAGANGGAATAGGGGLGGSAHNAPATFSGGRGGGRGASLTDTYWGQPGQGGGAIALIALGELSISLGGIVSTGGAGGEAGRNTWAVRHEMSAGGGAGSGGLVVLEAPTVALSGVVAAHGGGGGQGAVCSDEANPLGCLGIGGARGYTTPSAKGGQRKVTDPNPAGTGSDAAGLSSAGSGASGSFAPSGGGGGAGFVVIRYADRPGAFTKEGTITPTVDGVTPITPATGGEFIELTE